MNNLGDILFIAVSILMILVLLTLIIVGVKYYGRQKKQLERIEDKVNEISNNN